MSKPISKEQARERFIKHLRGLARSWAEQGTGSTQIKCEGVASSILSLIDGLAMEFPAIHLVLRPHPNDQEFRKERNEDYFVDKMAINDDCQLNKLFDGAKAPLIREQAHDRFIEQLRRITSYSAERRTSEPISKVQARETFINHLRLLARYWAEQPISAQDKCEGVVFSFLSSIDGSTSEFPVIHLVLRPHRDDQKFRMDRGEDYFVEHMAINDDCQLHEIFCVQPEDRDDSPSP